jgi:hypothetical protein
VGDRLLRVQIKMQSCKSVGFWAVNYDLMGASTDDLSSEEANKAQGAGKSWLRTRSDNLKRKS